MRRRLMAVVAVLSLLTGLNLVVAPSASAHPYCGLVWGSLAKGTGDDLSPGILTDIRAGRHACYDRLVLDIDDAVLTGWSVQYVDTVVRADTGEVVPLEGGARLEVVTRVPVRPTDDWFIGDGARVIDTTGYRTFRDVVWAGSTGQVSAVGLGVRARLPFRAFVLRGPGDGSRLVVDVAHRWCAAGHRDC